MHKILFCFPLTWWCHKYSPICPVQVPYHWFLCICDGYLTKDPSGKEANEGRGSSRWCHLNAELIIFKAPIQDKNKMWKKLEISYKCNCRITNASVNEALGPHSLPLIQDETFCSFLQTTLCYSFMEQCFFGCFHPSSKDLTTATRDYQSAVFLCRIPRGKCMFFLLSNFLQFKYLGCLPVLSICSSLFAELAVWTVLVCDPMHLYILHLAHWCEQVLGNQNFKDKTFYYISSFQWSQFMEK